MTTRPEQSGKAADFTVRDAGDGSLLTGILRTMDSLADACLVAEPDGRLRYANESARQLLRMKGRATGRKLPSVLAERHAVEIFEEAVAASRPRAAILPLTFSSDGARNFAISVVPLVIPGEGRFYRIALSPAGTPAALPGGSESAAVLEKLGDPLSIIQGYLENMLDGVIKEPAVMRQCLSAMQRQAMQMQRVLNALRS